MLVIPAIDIRGGRCVRLRQGDYSQETIYGDPVEVARQWLELGASYLHLVDLDGARAGRPVNVEVVANIVSLATGYEAPCQLGGGLRSDEDLQRIFDLGIARAIVGTRAIQEPDWLRSIVGRFPRKIVLGLDAKDGKLATHGWETTEGIDALEFLDAAPQAELAAVVYTDVSKDGMLTGPNFDATERMARRALVPVVASGGISSAEDVLELHRRDVPACILGRSLYEGRIDLSALLQQLSDRG
jgi:phosphoribosylformimino-5-aminoimidazole carboxamide ribotide isomerase